ncbi:hypothetical protein N7541_001836 [Penicillium brevicompactum]|uniref:NAD(P)-binding protein n=1 Tax=Penicillium brevicompactum TaxID=5074 RepID=A0A9W9UMZ3_PENBR|nr:hypothetical protein N7452_000012 [Penicillium brevicompactum]KAJ5360992.1 hypothetical protein N7541_001836 [Penicillium brevicompactum]
MTKVALITGGTSGIGFAVAEALGKTGNWQVNIIGSNAEKGAQAAASIPSTAFYQADVSDYDNLASVFDQVFRAGHRLDFVFVNAGIAEYDDYYAQQPDTGIPPKPDLSLVDVNMSGALYTSYLAMHYFRRSPRSTEGERNLVFTSSIGGIYPCALTPVYSSTKHALIGYVRSTGQRLWAEGVRVNAICPGVVQTPLFDNEAFGSIFPAEVWIEIHVVIDVVVQLLSGTEMVDGKGMRVAGDEMHSKALQISGKTFFFIEMSEFHDKAARLTWKAMMGEGLNL